MTLVTPAWLNVKSWRDDAAKATPEAIQRAIYCDAPGIRELAALLSPAAAGFLEPMAVRAQQLTRRHFGRTISLYVPLYLSDYCSSGCVYCGFASDRPQPRHRLSLTEIESELAEIKRMGFEEVLLLTGERTPEADFPYLLDSVRKAAGGFHNVTVEAFPMATDEYRQIGEAGCTGVTLYQETYDPAQYAALHRWGPKRDYAARVDAPARVLASGIRTVGIGVLLGLADPILDGLRLFCHAKYLRKAFWQGGISISFPRVCQQLGDFTPPHEVSEAFLAQMIFAFRICLPDVPLSLSTRERPQFRDGVAGIGISKMSIASRTTVGGYRDHAAAIDGQFHVNDDRDIASFCAMLKAHHLEPIFKNWDAVYR